MDILKPAVAGTLESSDVEVSIEPCVKGLIVNVESSVMNQYGSQIKKVVEETLKRLDVKKAIVNVNDKGALDCTIKARVECAVYRSCGISENLPWGKEII